MTTRKALVISALAGAAVGGAALIAALWKVPSYEAKKSVCPDFNQSEIVVNDTTLAVAIAVTYEQQAKGLGGCPDLPPAAGMIFPYDPPQAVSFWMKDMIIPLDIVWIRDGKVTGIERSAQPPAPSTPDAALTIYRSPGPIDHVLEIAAGSTTEYGIDKDSVFIQPN